MAQNSDLEFMEASFLIRRKMLGHPNLPLKLWKGVSNFQCRLSNLQQYVERTNLYNLFLNNTFVNERQRIFHDIFDGQKKLQRRQVLD